MTRGRRATLPGWVMVVTAMAGCGDDAPGSAAVDARVAEATTDDATRADDGRDAGDRDAGAFVDAPAREDVARDAVMAAPDVGATVDAPVDAQAVAPVDSSTDPPRDASSDARADGPTDAPHDVRIDASPDASLDVHDATGDAAVDAPVDTRDASSDAPLDARDVSMDAPLDARDASLDARDGSVDASADVPVDAREAPADVAVDVPVVVGAPGAVVLVSAGASWRYLDTGVAPPDTWRDEGFDDRAWRTGDAPLGYGNGDERTVIRGGVDPAHRDLTAWFRRTFVVADPSGVRRLLLRLVRDDGAVVHLNGREVYRSNMPTGPVDASTLAASTVGGADEAAFFEAVLPPDALRTGVNTLAVEIHQAAPDSSDLRFDLELASFADEAMRTDDDPVLLAAGDISRCSTDDDELTARILDASPGIIATLGDTVYETGAASEFRDCYAPTWGRHRARTHPAVGNHEYMTPGATGYYDYFGAAAGDPAQGWYSYEYGGWHVVVLNSNCVEAPSIGGCGADSPQARWLRADLAAHPTACALATWHHPRFTSGQHGSDANMQALWAILEGAGVDVVLQGHEHDYERFAPMRADGTRDDARGITSFVVGTGGTYLRTFATVLPNSLARNETDHGVLRLSLHADGYSWRFLPVAGRSYTDSGSARCH